MSGSLQMKYNVALKGIHFDYNEIILAPVDFYF